MRGDERSGERRGVEKKRREEFSRESSRDERG
jgi:hypothetical protein